MIRVECETCGASKSYPVSLTALDAVTFACTCGSSRSLEGRDEIAAATVSIDGQECVRVGSRAEARDVARQPGLLRDMTSDPFGMLPKREPVVAKTHLPCHEAFGCDSEMAEAPNWHFTNPFVRACASGHHWHRSANGVAHYGVSTQGFDVWCEMGWQKCGVASHRHGQRIDPKAPPWAKPCAKCGYLNGSNGKTGLELYSYACSCPKDPAPSVIDNARRDVDAARAAGDEPDVLTVPADLQLSTADHNNAWAANCIRGTPEWARPHAYKVAVLAVAELATTTGRRLNPTSIEPVDAALRAAWRAR